MIIAEIGINHLGNHRRARRMIIDLLNTKIDGITFQIPTKEFVNQDRVADYVQSLLEDIQTSLFEKALKFREDTFTEVDTYDEFKMAIEKGGFVSAHWDGTVETEAIIKADTKATSRCIPLDNKVEEGVCIVTGKPSKQRVLFAKAY